MRFVLFLAAVMSLPVFAAENVEIIHERQSEYVHCYRIAVSGERTLASVTVGSSWAGHPLYIESGGTLEITKVTPGWTAVVKTKDRYGYRNIEVKPVAAVRLLAATRGPIGAFCIATQDWPAGRTPDFSKLPYSAEFDDSGNRELGITGPGPGKWATEMLLEELLDANPADAAEMIHDARDILRLPR